MAEPALKAKTQRSRPEQSVAAKIVKPVSTKSGKSAKKLATKLKAREKLDLPLAEQETSTRESKLGNLLPSTSNPQPSANINELRDRLAQKIKTLRAQRKAPGSGTPGAPHSREEILKSRQIKDQQRKEHLKRKRAAAIAAASAAEEGENLATTAKSLKSEDQSQSSRSQPESDSSVFSKVVLTSGNEVDADGSIKLKKRKKGSTDLLGQLKHVEAKKARIANMDVEKRKSVEEKEKWKRAIKQAEGEKVRDDETMLKRSLKKQNKQKKKSAKEWKEREESVTKGIRARQRKREENIAARMEVKKKGRAKKLMAKTKRRPGFEGRSRKKS
ncbi:surfeit locus protein 6-domain-containing protein [Lipomyces oligophaga]|uniref:surfeit locus protein 6-domain-containing protein n=1 Tax=Lipomyces oligophaga TaxID=45792 RepID=UPI0034CE9BF3